MPPEAAVFDPIDKKLRQVEFVTGNVAARFDSHGHDQIAERGMQGVSDLLITEIGLERTPCFGPCPVFRVTLLREGSYHYVGKAYVAPLGEQSGRFSPADFERLAELVRELRVLKLDDLYPKAMENTESAITTVKYQGGSKVIRNGGGGPTRLWAFENLVEKTIWDVFRHESNWGRRGGPSLDPY